MTDTVALPLTLPAAGSADLAAALAAAVGLPAAAHFWALIPCAGIGARALPAGGEGGDAALPKQYQPVAGKPLVLHTLAAFAAVQRLQGTLVAVAPGDNFLNAYAAQLSFVVAGCGGATRAESVLGGLRELRQRGAAERDWVLVHDAARCLITPEQIDALIDACAVDAVGGLLAHKLADTLKTALTGTSGTRVSSTVDRSDKWLAQTPQMFRLGALQEAIETIGASVTDEASAMEAMGLHPLLVPGSALNFKVTYPQDFVLAQAVLSQRVHGGTVDRFGGERGQVSDVPAKTIF